MDLKKFLEKIYRKYNKRKFVDPDPLIFLYDYPALKNREIVALLASSFAYGRVGKILDTVSFILDKLESNPYDFLKNTEERELNYLFKDFVYRFTKSGELIQFFLSIKEKIVKYGSLGAFFKEQYLENDKKILNSLECFVKKMGYNTREINSLLSLPSKKSACKRLFLFLRWMGRRDEVDPGGWSFLDKSKLIIPLDTHMNKISKILNFTDRKQANLKTAIQITNQFKKVNREDPVKYDFALTRYGIRDELDIAQLKFQ